MPTLEEVVAALDQLYDPATAQEWDAVGLVCGDPAAPVRRILLAVDPVLATVEEALDSGADLLLTHHPLLLRPVHGVAATTYKGRLLHRLITAGVALHTAHTNADVARPGVSDALAAVLGLVDVRPLQAATTGAGAGFGRVGELPQPIALSDFVALAARVLPATPAGIRAAGDPDRSVRTVAVAGGAGDDLLGAAGRAGADVYLTADLRHHPASEHVEAGGPALVDVPHWATEQPWLHDAGTRLRAALDDTVETIVSELITDPWTMHRPADVPTRAAP